MQTIKFFYSIFLLLLLISCSNSQFQKKDIFSNDSKGKLVWITDLEDSYKKKHRFNKIFSKFSSKRFIPYYKFIDKTYEIVGSYNRIGKIYIIIKDKNNRYFKIFLKNKDDIMPSFLVFKDIFENAELLVGSKIWLNNIWDEENFKTKFPNVFYPFQKVTVLDVISFQNSDNGYPIWLKIITESGEDAIVRYNKQGVKVGIKDHYFTSNPLPFEWGNNINEKIKNREADIGMSSNQVRIAIGYPDKINSTSSRHGVSEQWIYNLPNKKIYYQFEYDKLVYINY